MRIEITVAAGSPTALPRIVSVLHKRAATVTYFEYRRGHGTDAVTVEIEETSRSGHVVMALSRLVDVLDLRQARRSGRSTLRYESRAGT